MVQGRVVVQGCSSCIVVLMLYGAVCRSALFPASASPSSRQHRSLLGSSSSIRSMFTLSSSVGRVSCCFSFDRRTSFIISNQIRQEFRSPWCILFSVPPHLFRLCLICLNPHQPRFIHCLTHLCLR